MMVLRQLSGMIALASYLVMGGILYLTVLPEAQGHWPPDFHLRGYDAASLAEFRAALSDRGRAAYSLILQYWDRIFICALALWLALMGWRGGGLRFVVAGLAVLYAAIDLSENAAICRFLCTGQNDEAMIAVASNLTMAKFAALYLCCLVLIWHLRRPR